MKPKWLQKLVAILKNRNQHDEGQVLSLNCCLGMNLGNVKRNSLQSIRNERCKVSVDLDKRRKLQKVSKMKRDTERLRVTCSSVSGGKACIVIFLRWNLSPCPFENYWTYFADLSTTIITIQSSDMIRLCKLLIIKIHPYTQWSITQPLKRIHLNQF